MTANDLLRSVQNKLPPETRMTGFLDTVRWVMRRIRAHGDRLGGWSFDWTRGNIDLIASYDTGTIAIVSGATTVTGTGTDFTAAMVGRKIRIVGVPYTIASRASATEVEIDTAYVGGTETEASFIIYQDEYATTANLSAIHRIWDMTNNKVVLARTPIALGDKDHRGDNTGNVLQYAKVGVNSSDVVLLQFQPAPTAVARLEYWYQADISQIADIGDTIDIPAYFDELVKQGCYARQLQILGAPMRTEELFNFERMMGEAKMADSPLRDQRIRLARDDDSVSSALLATTGSVASSGAGASLAVDWANPGQIGSANPNTGAFTTLSSSGLATLESLTVTNNATIGGTVTAGTAPTVLTTAAGLLRHQAIDPSIAGAGLTFTSGVLSVDAHTIASHSDTTATGAELETLTDGSNADALHTHSAVGSHTIASHSDTTATGAELETLTDGSDADALHTHSAVGSHTIASHSDTTATGAELETLTDNSMADALHRHSELSASDGTPDANFALDATGNAILAAGDLEVTAGRFSAGAVHTDNNMHQLTGSYTHVGVGTSMVGFSITAALTASNAVTTNQFIAAISSDGITTQDDSDTITRVATLWISEPDITKGATDTITVAATLYVESAPTEGAANYSLYVAAGNVALGTGDLRVLAGDASINAGSLGVGTAVMDGVLHAVDSAFANLPIFERSGQTSDTLRTAARVLATKTTSMGDGFGAAVGFFIRDDADVINFLGQIGAEMSGADNTGDIVFFPAVAGVSVEKMRLSSGGDLTLASGGEVFLNLPGSAGTTGSLYSNSGVVTVSP